MCPPGRHLGATRTIIDQIVDQAPEGLEVLRGSSTYVFDGNWKLQMENGADGYHVSSVHWNYAATMGHRHSAGTKAVDPDGWSKSVGGVYALKMAISCSGRNCSILRCARSMITAKRWRRGWGKTAPISWWARPAIWRFTPMSI
jgi:phenylpropionate dioxygenase-like ring-hydroxylating dioxygenase large terminal subunit